MHMPGSCGWGNSRLTRICLGLKSSNVLSMSHETTSRPPHTTMIHRTCCMIPGTE
jgi:hypothetical protein